MWAIATTLALANDLCLGTCADGDACESAAGCGGAPCAFPDACLPGLAALIESVEPEAPNALNTYNSGWACGYLTCVPTEDELAFSSSVGIYSVATRDLALTPGRTYLLRALLGADPGAYGYLDVVADDLYAASPFVWDAPSPVPITLSFEVPATHTGPLQLRLHADGPGYLHLSDLVVYDLVEYGVWIRFAAPGAVGPVRFSDDWIVRRGFPADDPHGYYPRACVGPVTPGCVDPALTAAVAEPGAFTPWIEASAMFSGGRRASHAWSVADASGAALSGAAVQVQMAWAPDADAILWDDTRVLAGDTVGIVLPDGVPPPLDLLTDRGYLADGALSDLPALLADPTWAPAPAPARYWTGSALGSIDLFDAPSTVDDSIDLFAAIGFNRRSFLTGDPSPALEARAHALGMDKDLLHGEAILAPWTYTPTDLDLDALRATADANLAAGPYAAIAADYPQRPQDLFVVLGDEIGGLKFDGPQYRAGFAEFLTAQGVSPQDLGVEALADVAPLTELSWPQVPQIRPDPLADPAAAHRFYWQLRWWNEATARAYAAAREAVEQAPTWGAPYPMSFNAGTPFAPHYFTYNLGAEYQTMARAGAVNALLAEGFLLGNDACRAQQLSWFADFAAGQARPWGAPLHAYFHAARGDGVNKVLTLASRGFRYFDPYMYGTYDLSTGDGAGGLGDRSAGWLARVAAGNAALAKAEPWLFDAVRAPAAAAILAPQSDPVWTGLAASTEDEAGWHLAWTHAHQPVDFIVEEHLAGELPGRAVLLLDRLHLGAPAWAAVQEWVEGGGTLILSRGLAARDAFGQPMPDRADWLGVTAGPAHDGRAEPERVTWGGTFEISTTWAVLSGGAPLATYRDGRPAAVEVAIGAGRVVVVGFDLGAQYLDPITRNCPSQIPPEVATFTSGWSDAVRDAAASLVAGLPRAVDVDQPLVEVVRLDRGDGGAIVALAYVDAPVTATITAEGLPAIVTETLSGATLPVVDGSVTVTLDHAAVLAWTADSTSTTSTSDPIGGAGGEPPILEEDGGGCGCAGSGAGAASTAALALVGVWARRRRSRGSDGPPAAHGGPGR